MSTMARFVHVPATLVVVVLLVGGCAAGGPTPSPANTSSAPPSDQPSQAAPTPTPAQAAPTPTPAQADPIATPARTAAPSAAPTGWAHITGVETGTPTTGTSGDGVTFNSVDTTNDPRANGKGVIVEKFTSSGSLSLEQGTYRLENAGGAWEGPCGGAEWNMGSGANVTCWLIGSGGYDGFTYYFNLRAENGTLLLDGLIYQGSPPTS
jgi:hypothetical protein